MDDQDLPHHRWPYGFDSLDFKFKDHALLTTDEVWVALLPLPTYGTTRSAPVSLYPVKPLSGKAALMLPAADR